jgi:hypothetical protein
VGDLSFIIILIDEDRLTDHPNLANSGYRGHRSRSVAASGILATAHVHPRWRPRHHAVTPCHRPVLAHSNATAHSHMLHRCSHALLPYPLVGQARLPNNWAEPCRVARLYGRLLLDLDRTNYEFMDQSVNVFFSIQRWAGSGTRNLWPLSVTGRLRGLHFFPFPAAEEDAIKGEYPRPHPASTSSSSAPRAREAQNIPPLPDRGEGYREGAKERESHWLGQ